MVVFSRGVCAVVCVVLQASPFSPGWWGHARRQQLKHYDYTSPVMKINIALNQIPNFTCLPNQAPGVGAHPNQSLSTPCPPSRFFGVSLGHI